MNPVPLDRNEPLYVEITWCKNVGKLLQSCMKLNEQVSTTSFVPPKESFLSCSTFKKQLILHQGTAAIPTKYKENIIVILLFVKFPWEPIPKKVKRHGSPLRWTKAYFWSIFCLVLVFCVCQFWGEQKLCADFLSFCVQFWDFLCAEFEILNFSVCRFVGFFSSSTFVCRWQSSSGEWKVIYRRNSNDLFRVSSEILFQIEIGDNNGPEMSNHFISLSASTSTKGQNC